MANNAATPEPIQLADPVLTIDQVADLLRVVANTVKYLHRMQKLRDRRCGRELRWRLSVVNEFVREHR